jgi:intracellular multiplication protein IcmL
MQNNEVVMAEDELKIVCLKDDFYQDGFFKVLMALAMVVFAIVFLVLISVILFLKRPAPVTFPVDNEWRILAPVPLDQPYLKTFDMLQWVSNVMPLAFTYDFVNYTDQLQNMTSYFTPDGWTKFLEQINAHANADVVQNSKLFINGSAAGAPFIINKGVLAGRYIWWVQIPIQVNYKDFTRSYSSTYTFHILVVRVPTLNNLSGVAIDNIIMTKAGG